MPRPSIQAVALAVAGFAGAPAIAAAPGDLLPEAPEKALVIRACTACHSEDQIVGKRRTTDDWNRQIGEMIDRGAVLTDSERGQVLNYLSKNLGEKYHG